MELIKVTQNEKNEQLVSGRELHEFLGVKSRFNDWIKNRINKYDFIENTDFTTITKSLVTAQGNRYEEIDYILKLDTAKELSMVENNEKGKEARRYFIECENKLKGIHAQTQQQRLYERSPQELLTDNSLALNKLFETMNINIPKELIINTAIHETKNSIGYDFPEVQKLLVKQDEESYHTKSEICKNVGIKSNKVNMALCELGLQEEGSTSMQPYRLTELGKKYAVERSFTNGRHQGYEIKLKKSSEKYIRENLFRLPKDWVK
ncbi:MAG: antA/AntB antirepressor family protein [Cetobacterium sp.]